MNEINDVNQQIEYSLYQKLQMKPIWTFYVIWYLL